MNYKDRILIKLDEMNQYLEELDKILPDEFIDYQTNLTVRRACEKTIELAIETVIDVISIIIAGKKLGIPNDEDSLISLVEKNKIISSSLAKKLMEMKGFRNILVHKYGDIDDQRVYEYLKEEIVDFNTFNKEINLFLKKS
ncbi:MAG TPA: DUF86 domain-containing protein [Candidatus Nanoarchaeia archaeon]|nr:DUF86 domain-containing protein [Candidatus Nanoarchaeia archaeon]